MTKITKENDKRSRNDPPIWTSDTGNANALRPPANNNAMTSSVIYIFIPYQACRAKDGSDLSAMDHHYSIPIRDNRRQQFVVLMTQLWPQVWVVIAASTTDYKHDLKEVLNSQQTGYSGIFSYQKHHLNREIDAVRAKS